MATNPSDFGLYLILTNPVSGYAAAMEAAVKEGVAFVQLRMKTEPPEIRRAVAARLREISRGGPTRLIINDDLELAMETDADGVHLGQDDIDLPDAKKRWNAPGKLFGLSTHSVEQAREAEALGADYIGVGPVFSTPTKPEAGTGLGVEAVAGIVRAVSIPAVAIGGINAQTLPQLLGAGIRNYCVIRAVNQSDDPAAAIRMLQEIQRTHRF